MGHKTFPLYGISVVQTWGQVHLKMLELEQVQVFYAKITKYFSKVLSEVTVSECFLQLLCILSNKYSQMGT